jgi:hypothetical protein
MIIYRIGFSLLLNKPAGQGLWCSLLGIRIRLINLPVRIRKFKDKRSGMKCQQFFSLPLSLSLSLSISLSLSLYQWFMTLFIMFINVVVGIEAFSACPDYSVVKGLKGVRGTLRLAQGRLRDEVRGTRDPSLSSGQAPGRGTRDGGPFA